MGTARSRPTCHGFVILSAWFLACSPGEVRAGGWRQVWADEFNGNGLADPAKWGYESGSVRKQEKQFYASAESLHRIFRDRTGHPSGGQGSYRIPGDSALKL